MPINPFIDFHTHHFPSLESGDEEIVSVFSHHELDQEIEIKAPHFFCAGAHPWYLPKDLLNLEARLLHFSKQPRFLAIGEIGLDRLRGEEISIQREFLEAQIEVATSLKSKAIIIHCVRSFDLFFNILKTTNYTGAFIFHDYRANEQISRSLLLDPRVYFSLGSVLFSSQTSNVPEIPVSRLFLETDEHNYSIKEVYLKFSNRTGIELSDLKEQIMQNFQRLFPSKTIA